MENFEFVSPTHFVFGRAAEEQIGQKLAAAGATKALVHFGGKSAKASGLLDRVCAALDAAGIAYVELGGVRPNPEITLVRQGVDLCKRENVDWIVAVGGGSVIDSAKAIANGACIEEDVWTLFESKATGHPTLPIAVVLTIPAAGSEASKNVVISNDALGRKTGYANNDHRPKFAFMNPELTFTLPPFQTAAGITDMYAHLLERFFDDVEAVPVTDNLNLSLMKTVRAEAPRVLVDPENYDARANIMWAGMMAHNNSCGVGRSQDWTSHGIEHELSALYDCAHGAGLAVVMPAVFTYNLKHDVMRFAKIAVRVWGCQMDFEHPERTAKEGIEALRSFLISIGMPKNFAELGAREEDIERLAHTCCYGDVENGTIGGFVPLNQEDVENIYRLML